MPTVTTGSGLSAGDTGGFSGGQGGVDPPATEHGVPIIQGDDLARGDGRLARVEGDAYAIGADRLDRRGHGPMPRADLGQAAPGRARRVDVPVESRGFEPRGVERLARPELHGPGGGL